MKKNPIKDKINFENSYSENLSNILGFQYKKLTMILLNEAKTYLKIKLCFYIDVIFTNSVEIKKINKKFRQINKSTDVLSFPNLTFKKPKKFNTFELNNIINTVIINGKKYIYLGSIVLNIDKVFYQAKKYNNTLRREYSFLILHSILHLFGYDHIMNNDEIIMINLQNRILNNLKIYR